MEDILVLLFHFEKVHKKTSYLKQAACLVYKNKVLLKIVHRFPSSYKAWLTLSLEDEQLQVCIRWYVGGLSECGAFQRWLGSIQYYSPYFQIIPASATAEIDSPVFPPSVTTKHLFTVFFNSLTFPFHGYRLWLPCIFLISEAFPSLFFEKEDTNSLTNKEISSRHSRNGGRWIWKEDKRLNKSSLKFPLTISCSKSRFVATITRTSTCIRVSTTNFHKLPSLKNT